MSSSDASSVWRVRLASEATVDYENPGAYETILKVLDEALNNDGPDKDALAVIRSFLSVPGIYRSPLRPAR
ncbi:hypothetical protein CVT25_004541 [Psilocybe cyanescens]|uniref:Uncharacterized protein n=1 Tax=Psilocybe cyanescens TaxID=93625 RepID=A0A409VYA6_PSICY|nr:hypothetical protein CVT25_004541 [Psilocybe cyanescens]